MQCCFCMIVVYEVDDGAGESGTDSTEILMFICDGGSFLHMFHAIDWIHKITQAKKPVTAGILAE